MNLLFITTIIESDILYLPFLLLITLIAVGFICLCVVIISNIDSFLNSLFYLIGETYKFIKLNLMPKENYRIPKKQLRCIERDLGIKIVEEIDTLIHTPSGLKVFPIVTSELIILYEKQIDSLKDYKKMRDTIKTNKVEKTQIDKILKARLLEFQNSFINDYEELSKRKTNQMLSEIQERYKFE